MADFEMLSGDYDVMTVTLGADVVKGQFVASNEVDGFYFADGDNGDAASVVTRCPKVEVIKNAGEAWAIGQAIYWDSTGGNCTTTVGTNSLIGYAIEAALSAAVLGKIAFDGTLRFAKA